MRIFLSYASEDKNIADEVYLALIGDNNQVFFDHTKIQPSENFNLIIQTEVNKSELFIFLISRYSLKKSSFALTELKFAREKWESPIGYVLPVIIDETDHKIIPPYLKAASTLKPEGDIAVEVSARVAVMRKGKYKFRAGKYTFIAVGTAILVLTLIVFALLKNSEPPPANNTTNNQSNSFPNQTPVNNTSFITKSNTDDPTANKTQETLKKNSPKPDTTVTHRAIVSSSEAEFMFPVDTKSKWKWNFNENASMAKDYEWEVMIKNAEVSYDFYLINKRSGNDIQVQGYFSELAKNLMSGGGYFKEGEGHTRLKNLQIETKVKEGSLSMILKGEIVKRVFSDKNSSSRPQEALLRFTAFREKLEEPKEVTIEYKD